MYERDLKLDESTRAVSKVSKVVTFVLKVVSDHHMSLSNSCIRCRDNKIVEDLSFWSQLL